MLQEGILVPTTFLFLSNQVAKMGIVSASNGSYMTYITLYDFLSAAIFIG